jgi:hypothetical protein
VIARFADYSEMIQPYLDNELAESELQDFVSDLEYCKACKREIEEFRTLSRQIKQTRPLAAAPASLREAFCSKLLNRRNRKKKAFDPQSSLVPLTNMSMG